MKTLLKSMTIGLSLIAGSQAMEPECMNQISQEKKTRELTATEKKNARKMMMINEALERHEDILKKEGEVVKDVSKGIGGKLHELSANPVLAGELVYTGRWEITNFKIKKNFKIRGLVKKDGCIDLSDPIFSDASKYLLITTDPEQFFNIVENSNRLVILIAPRFLIEDKIETITKTFQPIMANWKEDQVPIGIFYRLEHWGNSGSYYHLTSANHKLISKNNLFENGETARCCGPIRMPYGRHGFVGDWWYLAEKFHVNFE